MPQAKSGDTVKVHFTGKTQDGEVFASSYENQPLEFTLGAGQMLPGFEKAVFGMNVGDHKTAAVEPEEGYGERRDELVLTVDRLEFPTNFEPEVGMQLELNQTDGSIAILTVLAVNDKTVTLDANHPLAGKPLTFELELVGIT